jgi:hypothetical protein
MDSFEIVLLGSTHSTLMLCPNKSRGHTPSKAGRTKKTNLMHGFIQQQEAAAEWPYSEAAMLLA